METIYRNLDTKRAADKLRDLGDIDPDRHLRIARSKGSWNCGILRGKRVVIRRKGDVYQVHVYG